MTLLPQERYDFGSHGEINTYHLSCDWRRKQCFHHCPVPVKDVMMIGTGLKSGIYQHFEYMLYSVLSIYLGIILFQLLIYIQEIHYEEETTFLTFHKIIQRITKIILKDQIQEKKVTDYQFQLIILGGIISHTSPWLRQPSCSLTKKILIHTCPSTQTRLYTK